MDGIITKELESNEYISIINSRKKMANITILIF